MKKPYDTAEARTMLAKSIKAAYTAIGKLAAGEAPKPSEVRRKCAQIYDLAFYLDGAERDAGNDAGDAAHAAYRAALGLSETLQRVRREAELTELRQAVRAAQPAPHSYEHELAVLRGRTTS